MRPARVAILDLDNSSGRCLIGAIAVGKPDFIKVKAGGFALRLGPIHDQKILHIL